VYYYGDDSVIQQELRAISIRDQPRNSYTYTFAALAKPNFPPLVAINDQGRILHAGCARLIFKIGNLQRC